MDIPRRELYTPAAQDMSHGWYGKRITTITSLRDKNVIRKAEVDMKFSTDPVPIEHYLTHRPADPRCPICRSARLQKASAFSQQGGSEDLRI